MTDYHDHLAPGASALQRALSEALSTPNPSASAEQVHDGLAAQFGEQAADRFADRVSEWEERDAAAGDLAAFLTAAATRPADLRRLIFDQPTTDSEDTAS